MSCDIKSNPKGFWGFGVTTQEGVTVGGHHFELVFAIQLGDVDDGDIEHLLPSRTGDLAVTFLLVHTESQSSSSWFVDDALHRPVRRYGLRHWFLDVERR